MLDTNDVKQISLETLASRLRDAFVSAEDSKRKAAYWYDRTQKFQAKLERGRDREKQLAQKIQELEARLGLEEVDEEPDRFSGI